MKVINRQLCVYFPAHKMENLHSSAKAEGLSRSKLVNKAVDFYLAHQDTVALVNGQKK